MRVTRLAWRAAVAVLAMTGLVVSLASCAPGAPPATSPILPAASPEGGGGAPISDQSPRPAAPEATATAVAPEVASVRRDSTPTLTPRASSAAATTRTAAPSTIPRRVPAARPTPTMESLPAATESSAETWPTADGAGASLLVSAHPPCEGSQVSRALVAWLPNGTRVLYADGPQLYAVEADGSGLELLGDASPDIRLGTSRYVVGHVTHAMASPDGTHVAYAVCRYYEPDGYEDPQILACVRPWRESSDPKCDYPITAHRTYAFYDIPAEIGGLHYEVSVRHLPTDTTQRLFVGDAPVWSPDGSRIAFYVGGGRVYPGIFVDAREGATRFSPQRGLYTMAPDGSDVRRILPWNWTDGWGDYPDVDVPPAWSPDGRWLAIVRHGGDEQMIYLVEADVRAVPRRLRHHSERAGLVA